MNTSPKEAAPVPYEGYGTGDLKIELERAKQQIATLQQTIASLQAQRRKDVEDAWDAATERAWYEASEWKGVTVDKPIDKAQYLTKYDQTKTEGV